MLQLRAFVRRGRSFRARLRVSGFLCRASPPPFQRPRREGGVRPEVFGIQVRVLPQEEARVLNLDDDGVAHEPVEERSDDDRGAEDVAPFGESSVQSQDQGPFIAAAVGQPE